MTGVEILGAVAAAFKIVKDAPGALAVLRKLGVTAGLLEARMEKKPPPLDIDESQPVGILTKGLFDELKGLTHDYGQKKATWDQVERERHQKRVAAKACELLRTGEDLLKEVVESFDVVKRFFCGVASGEA